MRAWHLARNCASPLDCEWHKAQAQHHFNTTTRTCPETCLFCYPTLDVKPSLEDQHQQAHERGICLDGCLICRLNVIRNSAPRLTDVANDLAGTLEQRGERYGDYCEMSDTAQAFKTVLLSGAAWGRLPAYERESLDAIATKIARIVTGGSGQKDSWHDIQGYAKLAEDRC